VRVKSREPQFGMVDRALGIGVFLCDDLYMSNAGVMRTTYCGVRGKRTMKEASCHKFP